MTDSPSADGSIERQPDASDSGGSVAGDGAPPPPTATYWERPNEPWFARDAPVPAVGPAGGPPPRALEIVGRGVDLNVALSREIRWASLLIGLLFLAAIAPIVLAAVGYALGAGGIDWVESFGPEEIAGIDPAVLVVATLGLGAVAALSVDAQLVALALTGGRLLDRPVGLRAALGVARRRFWRLVLASILVGLILYVPRQIAAALVGRVAGDLAVLVSTIVDLVLSAPFAYVGAAIVLAGTGPARAVLASIAMARRRWRLAIVIGIVNTAVSLLAAFAIGAGADILVRVATAMGVEQSTNPIAAIVALGAIAIVAVGSLTVAIACLSAAPQVVAWIRLGGTADGLGSSDEIAASAARTRLVSIPMALAIVIEIVLAVLAFRAT